MGDADKHELLEWRVAALEAAIKDAPTAKEHQAAEDERRLIRKVIWGVILGLGATGSDGIQQLVGILTSISRGG
jgi:hypothetical protein